MKKTTICYGCKKTVLCDEDYEPGDAVTCNDCLAEELAGEAASIAYAESGGGSEMANDLWASRVYND